MLSGKELLEMRANKAHPRNLPAMPPKDTFPTHSAEEKAAIKSMIDEKMTYLEEQRAEKRNLLTTAEWLPNEKVARVDHRIGGGWDAFGYDKNGKTYLQPDETLFLLELSKLELLYGGTPVSVQQAYQLLLTEELCSLPKYRVYSHLCRQGYRLIRRTTPISSNIKRSAESVPNSSPKRIKIDTSAVLADGLKETQPTEANNQLKSRFQPPAADPSDYDCIPHLVPGAETLEIYFRDLQLLPENTQNRLNSYVINIKAFITPQSAANEEPEASTSSSCIPDSSVLPGPAKRQSLKDYLGDKNYMESIQSPLEKLDQIDNTELQISYDVYSPGRHFRKTNPGTPCYILAIANWNSPFPSVSSLARFKRECGPEISPLLAIAGPGSDVSFYQLKDMFSPLD